MTVDTETTAENVEEGAAVVPNPEDTQDSRTPEDEEGSSLVTTPEEEPKTFDLAYVQKLRKENASYRERAGKAEELSHLLHLARVKETGRLADPTDLPFDEAHLEDPEALTAAIEALLTRKPHLASRRPRGDVGQGATSTGDTVDLAGILRARAS